jgi:protein arginine N-methyltransferase 5
MLRAMETPYVVRPYAASQMCTESRCFEFVHENFTPTTPLSSLTKQENDQFATLKFCADTIVAGCGCGYGFSDPNWATAQSSSTTIPTAFHTGITIHGFLGTFEAILYGGVDKELNSPPVLISTRPSSFSTGMFSWFPLYFPLKEPIHVPYGTKVCLNVWRRGDSSRVWYEWSVEVVLPTNDADVLLVTSGIHNPNGRSYFVSL